jgi:diguanylate cyclase
MNGGSASKSLELLEKTYDLPMTNQYKNWRDSLRSRISQCLEQIEFLKLIDEAVTLLTQAWTQPTGTLNSTGPVIESLLQLIDQRVFPSDFTQQIEMLRSRLREELTEAALSQIRSDIIELASAMQEPIEKEVGDMALFLKQVTFSLQELQTYLQQANSARQKEQVESTLSTLNPPAPQPLQGQLDKRDEPIIKEQAEPPRMEVYPTIDSLTGIANYPAFDKRVALEWARWKRYGVWLSLIIMEVDQFEQINATLGHYSGDRVLKALAIVLKRELRTTDFLARYEAEKFALLLPETRLADAVHVAHRLRKAIEACNFHSDKVLVPVTLSCGVAEFHPEDTPESVLRRAEESLHLAKDSGKNRCCGEVELAAA